MPRAGGVEVFHYYPESEYALTLRTEIGTSL
jgi:hypothetical protein